MTPGAIQLHPWKRMILMQAKILAHCHRVINQKNMTQLPNEAQKYFCNFFNISYLQ